MTRTLSMPVPKGTLFYVETTAYNTVRLYHAMRKCTDFYHEFGNEEENEPEIFKCVATDEEVANLIRKAIRKL